MSGRNRFVLILPYWGTLPSWFGLYLRSLQGMCFDVLFVSDLEVGAHPDNFKQLKMSFEEFRRFAADKLSVRIGLELPIKLCDFKPMYGKIFENEIRDYGYWMFGDCDLVYGTSFNAYLERVVRDGYDVCTVRRDWVSGACCILKNTEVCRNLFMRAQNWTEVAGEPGRNNFWDECGAFVHDRLEKGELKMADCERMRDSFGAVVFRAKDLKVRHEDDSCESDLRGRTVVLKEDGDLRLDGREIILFHFVRAKRRRFFRICSPQYGEIRSCVIDETGGYFTPQQIAWRGPIGLWRKAMAAFSSLREHGCRRIGLYFRA